MDGKQIDAPPIDTDAYEQSKPLYIYVAGWKEMTVGICKYEGLLANANAYIKKIEEVVDVHAEIISIGLDRADTIVLRHQFD